MALCDRAIKKEIRKTEEEVSKWEVVVEKVKGIAPNDFDDQTYAVLKGRVVR